MPDETTRHALFWDVCIPVRLGVAAVALVIGYLVPRWLSFVAIYATITALGFAYNAALTLAGRKRYGGLGGLVWWSEVRWLHLILWSTTAVFASYRVSWAGGVLVADAFVGVLAGVIHFCA